MRGASAIDVSVVVPTYNRTEALLETLAALARVDYPADRWEVILVDDGSTDGAPEAVKKWSLTQPGLPLLCLSQDNAGPAAARNRGARAARGSLLIFIDNDILVAPDFVRAHIATHQGHSGAWVLGRIRHPALLRVTPFGRYRDARWESFHDSHDGTMVEETDGMSAANVSIPASDFAQLGGFDEDFSIASSEDWDLGFRGRHSGARVFYNPGIVVLHNDWAGTLKDYCQRQRLYSLSDVLLYQKYGDSSPRAVLIRENAPVDLRRDPLRLAIKKCLKAALATLPGRLSVMYACSLAEAILPDTRLCRRAYDTAVAVAIFQGVREGLARYRVRELSKTKVDVESTPTRVEKPCVTPSVT